MRYVTPPVFNYSFAVNNYQALYYIISNKKYRQMQFVVAGSLQDVFLMNGIEEAAASTLFLLLLCSGEKISTNFYVILDIHETAAEANS